MADYYLAPALAQLWAEINRRWPNRDKKSDGWIGDTSHQARKSDHNPDWADGGVVRAIDVDKDGINVNELLAEVVRDPRVAYVIWNRRISSATDDGRPWDWEPYYGSNPHDKHIHISLKHSRSAENNTTAWFGSTSGGSAKPPVSVPQPTGHTISLDAIEYAAKGGYFNPLNSDGNPVLFDARIVAGWLGRLDVVSDRDIRIWEQFLRGRNWKSAGAQYAGLMKRFQVRYGLEVDGIVGSETKAKLKQLLNHDNYRVIA